MPANKSLNERKSCPRYVKRLYATGHVTGVPKSIMLFMLAGLLEIGCGRGVGAEIIFERFDAGEVHAFDVDPQIIRLAEQRLAKYPAEKLRLYVGDAEHVDAPDNSYDAVFDFGIIHHIPAWQNAVKEVARILKPGGRFYFEEATQKALNRWFYGTFLTTRRKTISAASSSSPNSRKTGSKSAKISLIGFSMTWWSGLGRKARQM